jgi:sec-independent protein translocase protein TatA
MGNIGLPEMIFIFVLALLIFGPKKLPELGRSLGKGLAEFKRASAELKGSLEREMQNLEQDVKAEEAKPAATIPPEEPTQAAEDSADTTEDRANAAEDPTQWVPKESSDAATDEDRANTAGDPAKTAQDPGYQDYSYTEHRD